MSVISQTNLKEALAYVADQVYLAKLQEEAKKVKRNLNFPL